MALDRRILGRWESYDMTKTLQLEGDGVFYFADRSLSIGRTGSWSTSDTRISFGPVECSYRFVPDDRANNMWLAISSSEGSAFADRWWRKIRL